MSSPEIQEIKDEIRELKTLTLRSHGQLHSDLRGDMLGLKKDVEGVNNRLDRVNGRLDRHDDEIRVLDKASAVAKEQREQSKKWQDKLWHLLWGIPAGLIAWWWSM